MKDLKKKVERLEKDNREMLQNLREDFADFRSIMGYLQPLEKWGENMYIEGIKETCKIAAVAIKKYSRRKFTNG